MNADNERSITPVAGKSGTAGATPPRRRFPFSLVFIALLLFVQWPMFKGLFYKVSGTAAPASTIPWRSDFEGAVVEARASGKPLLLVFSAAWCPTCIVMKHDTWPDPEVAKAVTTAFVPVSIDVDDPAQTAAVRRFQISGIPAVLIVDAEGRVLKQEAFLSRPATLTFLRSEA